MSRRLAGALAALVLAIAGLAVTPGAPAGPVALAATPDLTVVTAARYEVLPAEARVAITLDLTVTNRLKDTLTRQYTFDRAYIAVMPGTSNFKVTAGSGTATPVVESRQATYWLLRLTLGSPLAAGRAISFKLSMDLRDPGGAATRPLRISPTLVSLPLWAYGSGETPGSSVAVTFPPDYAVSFDAGKLTGPRAEADGRRTWTATGLPDALAYYAYVVADKPGAYTETPASVPVGSGAAALLYRAWPDDPDWTRRVGSLFERGLPVLAERIGLPWPRSGQLVIQEAASRSGGGYAGLFDAAAGKVEVAYHAGSLVVLHEAAHAWFNGALLADRWANEAWASWYGLAAAEALGEKVTAPVLTDALRAGAVPLNDWGAVGETAPANEEYAYAASLELARLIAARAGDPELQRVWDAAAQGLGAYQPPAGPRELVDAPPDWRGLLDLFEDRGVGYDDLWRAWVARPDDVPLLDARQVARADLAALTTAAGDWRVPRTIRDAMRAWQFEAAAGQMAMARAVLSERERIAANAELVGLTPPGTLRSLFERDGALEEAVSEADAESAAIAAYWLALTSRPGQLDPVLWAGLLGVEPDADLGAARTAFAEGRLDATESASTQARLAWLSAADVGRSRLISAALLALAVVALLLAIRFRRRRLARLRPGVSPMVRRLQRAGEGPGPGEGPADGPEMGPDAGSAEGPGPGPGAGPGDGPRERPRVP